MSTFKFNSMSFRFVSSLFSIYILVWIILFLQFCVADLFIFPFLRLATRVVRISPSLIRPETFFGPAHCPHFYLDILCWLCEPRSRELRRALEYRYEPQQLTHTWQSHTHSLYIYIYTAGKPYSLRKESNITLTIRRLDEG